MRPINPSTIRSPQCGHVPQQGLGLEQALMEHWTRSNGGSPGSLSVGCMPVAMATWAWALEQWGWSGEKGRSTAMGWVFAHWWRTCCRYFINIYSMNILTWSLRDTGAWQIITSSDSRFLHLPFIEKALRSLPWRVCSFSLAIIFRSKFRLFYFVQLYVQQKTPSIYAGASLTISEQFLIAIWKTSFPGYSP